MGYIEKTARVGGVINNTELALATATEANVLSGLTFYAGDKELKMGTYTPTFKLIGSTIGGRNGDYYPGTPQTVSISVPEGYKKLVVVGVSFSHKSWSPNVTLSTNTGTLTQIQSNLSTAFMEPSSAGGLVFKTALLTGASSGCTVKATGGEAYNCAGLAVFAVE